MKNDEIYTLWNEFINDARYKKYFDLDNVRDWKIKLEELKNFIDTNNAKPHRIKNKELNCWIYTQLKNEKERKQIMKNNEIYTLWTEFITNSRYKKKF